MPEEGSSGSKHKRQRTLPHPSLGRSRVGGLVPPDAVPNAYPTPWMQPSQPWPPAQQLHFSSPWMTGGQPQSMPYGHPWMMMPQGGDPGVREDSLARASRRHKQQAYDAATMSRTMGGQKPNKLRVKEGGDIDGGCPGKNAWDDAVRSLVPRILDMSIIEWEAQKSTAVEKLREALDADFEYTPVSLSQRGFRNAIKRFMKTERSRLKARYAAGHTACPLHIDPWQWERLQDYWGSNLQREKAEKMSIARQQVKNLGNVGRKGRDGKEAEVVSANPCNSEVYLIPISGVPMYCLFGRCTL